MPEFASAPSRPLPCRPIVTDQKALFRRARQLTALMAVVLILGAKSLETIPVAGPYLATMFASLGTAFFGASVVAIVITLGYRLHRDWLT